MDPWTKKFEKKCLSILFRAIEVISSVLFWIIYRGSGDKMLPIKNLLLLDSAFVLAHKIRTRKVTSQEVVEAFITRIKEVNPVLNCVVDESFETALKEAKSIDEFIRSEVKPVDEIAKDTPFLGVPFTSKESLEVKGMSHTAGLHCRKGFKAPKDAEAIFCMRKSGAIPLAVTNVSEACMWWESNNSIYGRTNNPYNTSHIVGGSSGGEGCLLAAAGSPLGIGSDIGGSIRMPAFFNGIFGHKPSKGIVSNVGLYPEPKEEQNNFLGVGPMSRFATDLLPCLKVIAGKNVHKLQLDKKVDVSRLKFFYMEDDGGSPLTSPVCSEIKAALHKVVLYLDKAYGIKATKIHLPSMKLSGAIWFAKMKTKSGPTFSELLCGCKGSVNVYFELLKWFVGLSNHTFIGLATALAEKFGIKYGSSKHSHLLYLCSQLNQELQDLLGAEGVLLYPTHPTAAPYHNEPLVKPLNFSYTGIFNVLCMPATHCPLGLNSKGIPLGLQVVASLFQDHLTLAVAEELEKAFGGWVPAPISV